MSEHEHIKWIIPNAVIYQKFVGNHTVEKIHEATDILLEMLDSSDRVMVHYVMDVSELKQLPTHLRETINASRRFYEHPKLGWSVTYGSQNQIFRMIGSIVTGMFRVRFRIFEHQHQAYQFLNEVDETLPPLISS